MRVSENREVQVRPACEQLLGVLRLGPLGAVEHGPVAGVVREPAGQLVCDPGAHVGMQHPERSNRRPVAGDPVHEAGAPVLLGQPVAVGDDDHTGGGEGHGPQARNRGEASQALSCPGVISSITLRVNYSETDQMGVVYHANYLIWFDRARTELMRETGLTYKELEQQGVYLAVSEVNVRYRAAARYDDLVRVRCWVRELASRRVTFGYAVERAGTDDLLATGETSLISLTHQHTLTRMPQHVLDLLKPIPDPVRL